MIRKCRDRDMDLIFEIINDSAKAYEGVIPDDCRHDPYMGMDELRHEIESGVLFWGYEEEGVLEGVMGIQDKRDVVLIRHAYVRTSKRNLGIGKRLLRFLESKTAKPILIGTWAAATWAIAFYEKNGYRRLGPGEKDHLLRKYWTIPERQQETSVVLAHARWAPCSFPS
jgi:GNAT superfamily N-acetyltransferase